MRLGDAMMVRVDDVSITRRTVYGVRIGGGTDETGRKRPGHSKGGKKKVPGGPKKRAEHREHRKKKGRKR